MSNRPQTVLAVTALIFVILFTLFGLWVGTPKPNDAATFAATLKAFASDTKTRIILSGILIDVITGIAAALHLRVFDPQAQARFYVTNVLPYVLGYFLVWCITLFGLESAVAPTMQETLASIGFAMIASTLTSSISANITNLRKPAPVES